MSVQEDVYADVRLWQAEVWATGLAGLYLPKVARLDIVHPSRRGMLWQELQVLLETGPPIGVVRDPLTLALEPHAARIKGRQGRPRVHERLAVQWDIGGIRRGGPAAPLHFQPLRRGAPEVACLICTPEGSALNIPEALLSLGFSQRHEAPFEGVSHHRLVAQHALGCRCETSHGGKHAVRRERRLGDFEGGRVLRWACAEAVVPEAESPDLAHGVGLVIDCSLQAFEPSGWGELRFDVSPLAHRALEIGRIRRGWSHWAQVVLRRAGDRIGAGFFQPDHQMGDGEEEGEW